MGPDSKSGTEVPQEEWTISQCPECGRDNTACLSRAIVYHHGLCAYGKEHLAAPLIEVIPAARLSALPDAFKAEFGDEHELSLALVRVLRWLEKRTRGL